MDKLAIQTFLKPMQDLIWTVMVCKDLYVYETTKEGREVFYKKLWQIIMDSEIHINFLDDLEDLEFKPIEEAITLDAIVFSWDDIINIDELISLNNNYA